MSIGLILICFLFVVSAVAWIFGMFAPAIRKGRLALWSSLALLLPGLAVLLRAPLHLIGIYDVEAMGFFLLGIASLFLGLIALTLALLARARFHPFGSFEQEN